MRLSFLYLICLVISVASCKNEPSSADVESQDTVVIESSEQDNTKEKDESLVPEQEPISDGDQSQSGSTGTQGLTGFMNSRNNQESKSIQDKRAANIEKDFPMVEKAKSGVPINKDRIPRITRLISVDNVSEIIGIDAARITEKEVTSNQNDGKLRSCFYKWKEEGNEDAGIFLQIQANPIGDELPDWAPTYMQSKRNNGELSYPSDGNVYTYTPMEGIVEEALYCHELKKVVWRPNSKHIITLADNYTVSDKNRLSNARKFAELLYPKLNQ